MSSDSMSLSLSSTDVSSLIQLALPSVFGSGWFMLADMVGTSFEVSALSVPGLIGRLARGSGECRLVQGEVVCDEFFGRVSEVVAE